jgi:putative tryptophan/tyrosine transport system substrate-binding protein
MKRLRRREFVAFLGSAAAWSIAARAQQPAKVRRLGVLSQDPVHAQLTPPYQAFQQSLRELGWVEGQNLAIEWRFSEGKADLLPRLAAELVDLPVDLIVAIATPPALAAAAATGTIPIVFIQVADPVALGIVPSLARPDGNVTGLSNMLTDFGEKRLQLVKELWPRATRVAFLWNRSNQASALVFRELERASRPIGLELKGIGVSSRGELKDAVTSAAGADVAAVMLQDDTLITSYLNEIVSLATRFALPIFSLYSEYVDGGGLISYGPSRPAIYRRGASYVDRILKGANPSDLPVEQPVRLELVINLHTAKALGISIPDAVLVRADRVIE